MGINFLRGAGFQRGMIILWSGSVVSIPSGWQLCDGTNGTPNLRDRFIVGAGGAYAVGVTGGSTTHFHSVGVTIDSGSDIDFSGAGTYSTQSFGNTVASPNLPPYYALAYIMKL